jgi:hypothetical protein
MKGVYSSKKEENEKNRHPHPHPPRDSMPWGKREVLTVVLIVRECIEEDQVGSHVCGGRLPLCPVDLEHTVGDKEELPLVRAVAAHNVVHMGTPELRVDLDNIQDGREVRIELSPSTEGAERHVTVIRCGEEHRNTVEFPRGEEGLMLIGQSAAAIEEEVVGPHDRALEPSCDGEAVDSPHNAHHMQRDRFVIHTNRFIQNGAKLSPPEVMCRCPKTLTSCWNFPQQL